MIVEHDYTLKTSSRQDLDSVAFRVSETDAGSIMGILRDSLYGNKIRAVVREYATNARDAHAEAGRLQLPIKLEVPTLDDPTFRVRDYGHGLSPDEIRDVYASYGASTKRSTNEQTGMLGIGCKSAFAYADSFRITSYQAGVRNEYQAVLDESGLGKIMTMGHWPTEEPDGVEIVVPAKQADFSTFLAEALEVASWFPEPLPLITQGRRAVPVSPKPQSLPTPTCTLSFEDGATAYLWQVKAAKGVDVPTSCLVMGGVCYPLQNVLELFPEEQASRLAIALVLGDKTWKVPLESVRELCNSHHWCIQAPIGAVDVAASREGLQYTARTKTYVLTKLLSLLTESLKAFIEEVKSLNTWQAYVLTRTKRSLQLYGNLFCQLKGLSRESVNLEATIFPYSKDTTPLPLHPRSWFAFLNTLRNEPPGSKRSLKDLKILYCKDGKHGLGHVEPNEVFLRTRINRPSQLPDNLALPANTHHAPIETVLTLFKGYLKAVGVPYDGLPFIGLSKRDLLERRRLYRYTPEPSEGENPGKKTPRAPRATDPFVELLPENVNRFILGEYTPDPDRTPLFIRIGDRDHLYPVLGKAVALMDALEGTPFGVAFSRQYQIVGIATATGRKLESPTFECIGDVWDWIATQQQKTLLETPALIQALLVYRLLRGGRLSIRFDDSREEGNLETIERFQALDLWRTSPILPQGDTRGLHRLLVWWSTLESMNSWPSTSWQKALQALTTIPTPPDLSLLDGLPTALRTPLVERVINVNHLWAHGGLVESWSVLLYEAFNARSLYRNAATRRVMLRELFWNKHHYLNLRKVERVWRSKAFVTVLSKAARQQRRLKLHKKTSHRLTGGRRRKAQ